MEEQERISLAVVCMVLAMVSITAGASLAKSIFPVIGAQATTALRLGFGAAVLFVVFRPWRYFPSRDEWKAIAFYGAALGTMNLVFYMAIARLPLGIALALQFTGPLTVALLGTRSFKDVIWVGCAVCGILLLLPISEASAHLDGLGVFYALLSGVFWALYIIAGKRAGAGSRGGVTVAWGMMVAAAVVAPVGVAMGDGAAMTSHILLLALGVAVLSSAIPYTLEIVALKRLPSKTFSILTSLEPAVGAVSGFIFLSERLSLVHLVAIALIVLASSGSTYFASRKKPVPELAN